MCTSIPLLLSDVKSPFNFSFSPIAPPAVSICLNPFIQFSGVAVFVYCVFGFACNAAFTCPIGINVIIPNIIANANNFTFVFSFIFSSSFGLIYNFLFFIVNNFDHLYFYI